MTIKKKLGQKIRNLRLMNNMTQEALAENINISPKSLSQIECGNNFVSSETLEVICKALNTTPKALFDFEYIETNNKDLMSDISDRLKNNPILLHTIHKITVALDE
ncbi:helix-turn-helix transcriptional regulator [bacterium]|nr:helix-turn-helix transcriptional regulator [bacterium]